MAEPVKITFLGGLGEIGRNCACIEVDGSILLLDCGLMFPDLEMLGIDLVLPDFSYLHENAERIVGCIVTHGHDDHVGGLSFLLRELSFPIYGSALTLGLASNRIDEAGLLGRTELIPVKDGERRRIGPFDVEFIPVTHSVPHGFATAFHTAAGRDPALGRLEARPHAGRRPPHRSRPHRRHRERRRHPVAAVRQHQRRGARLLAVGVGRRAGALRPVPRVRGSAHHHHVLRVAHPSRAADRRRRHRVRPHHRHDGHVDAARTCAWRARWVCCTSRTSRLRDIEDVGDLDPGKVCVISTGSQGEPMSALALLASSENRWLTPRRGRRRDHELAPDPRQRVQRVQGDRRPRAPRRRGRALGHLRRARHGPRQAGGAQDPAVDRAAGVLHAGARRVSPPRRPLAAGPT